MRDDNRPKTLMEKIAANKENIYRAIAVGFAAFSIFVYNPASAYFTQYHWIMVLTLLILAGAAIYYIYYNELFPIKSSAIYIISGTAVVSMIFGTLMDSSMKDVKLIEAYHYKASGGSKINVKGKIKNIGNKPVKKCYLSVTVRVGDDPDKRRPIDPKKMFTPSTGLNLNFDFKINSFSYDQYWVKTVKILVLDKYFPKRSVTFYNKTIDVGKSVPYPNVKYVLKCK